MNWDDAPHSERSDLGQFPMPTRRAGANLRGSHGTSAPLKGCALLGMDAYGNHDGCDRMAWRQVDLLLRFAIASAFLSNASSAIFCARLTSAVANPCNVRHHAKASSPCRATSATTKRSSTRISGRVKCACLRSGRGWSGHGQFLAVALDRGAIASNLSGRVTKSACAHPWRVRSPRERPAPAA
jgi:hypothetical protein